MGSARVFAACKHPGTALCPFFGAGKMSAGPEKGALCLFVRLGPIGPLVPQALFCGYPPFFGGAVQRQERRLLAVFGTTAQTPQPAAHASTIMAQNRERKT